MNSQEKNAGSVAKRLAVLAVFTAFAFICVCIFHIKVSFLTFDIKDAVITVAAMLFGPSAGITISLAVSLIELITISDTGIYGFIMNFLSSAAFSSVAALIYKYKRNMLGAILGLLSSVVAMTAVMLIANLIITPFYTGMPTKDVAALIPKLLFPFNLTKAVLNASIVMLIYKPVSGALRRVGVVRGADSGYKLDRKTVIAMLLSIVVMAASLTVFFNVLNGSVTWF